MQKLLQYIWGGITLTSPLWASPLQGVISHHTVLFSVIGSAAAWLSHILAGTQPTGTTGAAGAGK